MCVSMSDMHIDMQHLMLLCTYAPPNPVSLHRKTFGKAQKCLHPCLSWLCQLLSLYLQEAAPQTALVLCLTASLYVPHLNQLSETSRSNWIVFA